jgi:protein ImuB
MLWLAVHLPRFAVEVCAARAPAVTVAGGRVLAVDREAQTAGVRPGMRLSSALGLAPALTACEPAPRREAAALAALACWAGGFSPQVSLAPPDEMLLEIGGCLRLFGGLAALLRQVDEGCAAQGYSYRLGLAPTPLAAQWFARAGVAPDASQGAVSGKALRAQLDPLPVGVLGLDPRQRQRLAVLGLRTVGQLLALPGAALARRFGPELPLQLAQTLGEAPDPRPTLVFPEHFAQRLELPAKVERADMLLFAAHRLMLALAGWLHARAAGIRECRLVLVHDGRPATPLTLGFAAPTRNGERLLRVLRERLDRLPLGAPVSELRLEVDAPVDLPGTNAGLFGETTAEAIAPVVERLRARLGQQAVHGLAIVADHRPECASRPAEWPQEAPDTPLGLRPLWLLPTPRALAEYTGSPWHEGRLRLLTRAERIESGWWDSGEDRGEDRGAAPGDVRRDYFVALNPGGEWLWIFRDGQGWWLHGVFA